MEPPWQHPGESQPQPHRQWDLAAAPQQVLLVHLLLFDLFRLKIKQQQQQHNKQ